MIDRRSRLRETMEEREIEEKRRYGMGDALRPVSALLRRGRQGSGSTLRFDGMCDAG